MFWKTSFLCGLCVTVLAGLCLDVRAEPGPKDTRANILFAIADDWGWPHASAYGDPVVKTPAFDRLAKEGALFHHAYVASPSCTPCRGNILTGQWFWRLGPAGNLWCVFPDRLPVYPEQLEKAGYVTGVSGKGWGPGRTESKGRNLTGPRFPNFQAFLKKRDSDKPFCYWLGSSDPHRPYKKDSGAKSGLELDKIKLPGCFPDSPMVRGDVADYYFEVQRFDKLVGSAMAALEQIGELDNTIILMTGDHGMPFPRCKGNVYDSGARVPLAVRWPGKIKPGRVLNDFVSFSDFAPTFMEIAGLKPLDVMTGRSLMKVFTSEKSGRADSQRDYVLMGRERHCPGQEAPDMGGYPHRAIRTHEYLYIKNFLPDRWPAGTPNYQKAAMAGAWYGDCDNGPTKTYMVDHKDKDETHKKLFNAAFGKRPAEELYDLKKDTDQLNNVAAEAGYADVKKKLAEQLMAELKKTEDPRVVGGGEKFDKYPYLGGVPRHPNAGRKKKK